MFFRKIWKYLTFAKQKEEGVESNTNLKLMHGINRISIFMFLFCIVVMVVRCLR